MDTPNDRPGRRAFLKSAVAGSAAAATAALPLSPAAQAAQPAAAAPAQPGYLYLNPDEQAFVEAVVDHMIPADEYTPKGTDVGINIYIDRALASGWGKGERLYMQGPWKRGTASQGYQLPMTPAQLYRAGIAAANRACVKAQGKRFEQLGAAQREDFLKAWQAGKVEFDDGLPARTFFNMLYQNVMEGLFADPVYGGNRDKAGWKLIGFPGVVAVHARNVGKFRDKPYVANPLGIADLS